MQVLSIKLLISFPIINAEEGQAWKAAMLAVFLSLGKFSTGSEELECWISSFEP
jgi:hypothetical protein